MPAKKKEAEPIKRKRGRPKTRQESEPFMGYVPTDLMTWLRARAAREDRTITAELARILRAVMDAETVNGRTDERTI